jgi:integrase
MIHHLSRPWSAPVAGRKPKLNWTPCFNQYTCTIGGKFHRLGQDEEAAEKQFKFLLRQSELDHTPDPNITFAVLADTYLDEVKAKHVPERYRHVTERLQEFKDHLGDNFRAKDIRAKHVESWIAKKTLSDSSERLYKSIILGALNWAAKPRSQKGGELIHENPIRGQLHLPVGESWGKEAVWEPEMFDQVFRVSSQAFANLVRILVWTGARITTIAKIEARHYNKLQSRWDCEDLCRGNKMAKHIRLLNDEARELVERLNLEHPTGPIFRNAFGTPWVPDAPQIYMFNLQHKFKETKVLKWQKGIAVSGLRHTFATKFLEKYPNEIEYLRILLGHANYKMIFAHYGHLVDQHRAAFNRLEGFSPITSGASASGPEVAAKS